MNIMVPNMNIITIQVICLFTILVCLCLTKAKPSWNFGLTVILLIAGLVSVFLFIYAFFFYKWGLSPAESLEDKDWLAFLSGYLSFSGSLVMAWLVFKQSAIINQFTIQEYGIHVKGEIDDLTTLERTKSIGKWTLRYPNNNKDYFKYDLCVNAQRLDTDDAKYKNLLWFKFYNYGKLPIHRLSFNHVIIRDLNSEEKDRIFFVYKGEKSSPFNGIHSIVPNDWVQICFVLPPIENYLSKKSYDFKISFSTEGMKSEEYINFVLYCDNKRLFMIDGKNVKPEI